MQDERVRKAVEQALAPAHFFVAPPGRLRSEHAAIEEAAWDVFRGHLLPAAHSNETRHFELWRVFVDSSETPGDVPLLLVHWDRARQQLHIVRQILVYGHEAYESSPGVIESRPAEVWSRELVGTIAVGPLDETALAGEVARYVLLAVVGTSRLPITSLESPLPAFSLGQVAYWPGLKRAEPGCWSDPVAMLVDVLGATTPPFLAAKALEVALRAGEDEQTARIPALLASFGGGADGADRIGAIFRELFNGVALSPYTTFVDRLVRLLGQLAETSALGPERVVDLISYMLRHLCRHLTAFDLKTFHNYGANYPDALFLDALLKLYLQLIDRDAGLWLTGGGDTAEVAAAKRIRRRALRQACLARRHYQGHRVPDVPTSQGESQRVLPPQFARVAEAQIVQPGKRKRELYADDSLDVLLGPAARRALEAGLVDLAHSSEMRELGMATFLDRPLGAGKEPGEIDRTPLVSYVAASRSTMLKRLGELELAGWLSADDRARLAAAAEELPLAGLAVGDLELIQRPGVVSLADACRAAPDFFVLRTTRGSLDDLAARFDLAAVERICGEFFAGVDFRGCVLIGRSSGDGRGATLGVIALYDGSRRLRAEFAIGGSGQAVYVERGGVELPAALHLVRVWQEADDDAALVERDLSGKGIVLSPGT